MGLILSAVSYFRSIKRIDMYGDLYQYLILYKQLNLPGIGRLFVEKKPAQFDVADKVVNPPSFTIALQSDNNTPPKSFFNWLGSKLGITERDAVIRFNDFLFELKKQISAGNKLEWAGIGTISKGLGGDIKLEPSIENYSPGIPVSAIKVLRENAEHNIRVGEDQKTSSQMREILHHSEDGRKTYWWTAALVLVILAIIFIGYYFSANGLNTSAASNQQKAVPAEQTKTH
jgi:hypothetical protein